MTQLMRIDTQSLANLNKVLIGFDRIVSDFENSFQLQSSNYPPHNLIQFDEDNYEIQLAVAGFDQDEISVELVEDRLIIRGEHVDVQAADTVYLHRGLAQRNFQRVFPLAEYIEVLGAETSKGILKIKLQRQVPESAKPKKIAIKQVD
jgi:molecular chaperone IbpA